MYFRGKYMNEEIKNRQRLERYIKDFHLVIGDPYTMEYKKVKEYVSIFEWTDSACWGIEEI